MVTAQEATRDKTGPVSRYKSVRREERGAAGAPPSADVAALSSWILDSAAPATQHPGRQLPAASCQPVSTIIIDTGSLFAPSRFLASQFASHIISLPELFHSPSSLPPCFIAYLCHCSQPCFLHLLVPRQTLFSSSLFLNSSLDPASVARAETSPPSSIPPTSIAFASSIFFLHFLHPQLPVSAAGTPEPGRTPRQWQAPKLRPCPRARFPLADLTATESIRPPNWEATKLAPRRL